MKGCWIFWKDIISQSFWSLCLLLWWSHGPKSMESTFKAKAQYLSILWTGPWPKLSSSWQVNFKIEKKMYYYSLLMSRLLLLSSIILIAHFCVVPISCLYYILHKYVNVNARLWVCKAGCVICVVYLFNKF